MKDLYLEIITPDRKIYNGEIRFLHVPGTKGSFAVLRNHAPIISTLNAGRIRLIDMKKTEVTFQIEGGIIEVMNNKIIILAETI